jgi:hypothetical protein
LNMTKKRVLLANENSILRKRKSFLFMLYDEISKELSFCEESTLENSKSIEK